MKMIGLKTAFAGLLIAATATSALAQQVTGAGATFPAPLYAKWADAYNKATGVRVNYQSVGSGAGTAPDPRQDRRLRRLGHAADGRGTGQGRPDPVPDGDRRRRAGVQRGRRADTRQLRLTGPVLGDIYLGKITKWNDPAIVALNPGVKLPDAQIAVVRRADGSGTTFIFTNYLSKVNAGVEVEGRRGHGGQLADGRGRQGQRGRRRLRAAPAELDRLRRVRLRQAEQARVCADAELPAAPSLRRMTTRSRRRPRARTGRRASTRS